MPGTANIKCDPVRWAEVVQNSGPTFTLEQLKQAAGITAEQPEKESEQPQEEQTATPGDTWHCPFIVAPYWTVGTRHALAMALSGYLAKAEWSWKDAKVLLLEIGRQANDEELWGHLADLKSTYQRIAQGKPVAGFSSLESLLSADDLQTLQQLVGVQEIPIDDTPPKLILITKPYSDIQERDTRWLWYPYYPDRTLVSVEGNLGEGKSWIPTVSCAAVSVGKMPFLFSDGRPMEEQKNRDLSTPANVLHLNIEDDPEETIKKRLRILGADCSRVFCIEGMERISRWQ